LWLDPQATMNGMFGNRIAAAFVTDLLCVVLAGLIWIVYESEKIRNEKQLDVRIAYTPIWIGRATSPLLVQS
jgi:hypothetical protein